MINSIPPMPEDVLLPLVKEYALKAKILGLDGRVYKYGSGIEICSTNYVLDLGSIVTNIWHRQSFPPHTQAVTATHHEEVFNIFLQLVKETKEAPPIRGNTQQ